MPPPFSSVSPERAAREEEKNSGGQEPRNDSHRWRWEPSYGRKGHSGDQEEATKSPPDRKRGTVNPSQKNTEIHLLQDTAGPKEGVNKKTN